MAPARSHRSRCPHASRKITHPKMAQSWYQTLCTQPCKTLSTLLPIPPPCPVIPIPTPKSLPTLLDA
eukprot:scaffold234482_cov32-Attheya_sp.AAC.1